MPMRPPIRATHTVAELELSPAAYDEIAKKLRDAGYDHAFLDGIDEGLIDMTGIGVTRGEEEPVADIALLTPPAQDVPAPSGGSGKPWDMDAAFPPDVHMSIAARAAKEGTPKPPLPQTSVPVAPGTRYAPLLGQYVGAGPFELVFAFDGIIFEHRRAAVMHGAHISGGTDDFNMAVIEGKKVVRVEGPETDGRGQSESELALAQEAIFGR